jgi:hypothetical protein
VTPDFYEILRNLAEKEDLRSSEYKWIKRIYAFGSKYKLIRENHLIVISDICERHEVDFSPAVKEQTVRRRSGESHEIKKNELV